jgi:chromosome segregation ATPase
MIFRGGSRIAPVPENNHESRFTRIEHEVTHLREDVASARALAALADRDVAELRTEMRAHHRVLNALRETQLEQGGQLGDLRQQLGDLRQQLGDLRQQLDDLRREMREGFAMQSTGMAQITALLTAIAGPERGNN